MGWDIFEFKNLQKSEFEDVVQANSFGSLPIPLDFKFTPGMNLYWLNLLPDYVQNNSDRVLTFNGLIGNHYLTPSNEQVSVSNTDNSSDYSMDDYEAHAKKSQAGMATFLGTKYEKGTYKFTTGDVMDSDYNELAKGISWTIEVK